jgi:hypothetical protein
LRSRLLTLDAMGARANGAKADDKRRRWRWK